MSLLRLQEVNIGTYEHSIPISESSIKLLNQEYFTLTFPKQPQPGREKTPRLSKLHITVPRCDKRNLEEFQMTAHKSARHSLRKIYQRPSIYFTIRRQVPFRHLYTPKTHPEKAKCKKLKNDKKETNFNKDPQKNIGPHETTPESKNLVNDQKTKRGNKADKTPSKSSHESELSKKSKYKSEANPESKNAKEVLMKDPKENKRDSKNSKETSIKPTCTKKNSKNSKNNSNAKSETCSKNCSNMDLVMYLKKSSAESMEFDMWLKNYSQNNSKKTSRTEATSSDAESVDSKHAKKDKKGKKKDEGSADTESVDSKNAKQDSKKAKKYSKKKNAKKHIESTETEFESEFKSKKGKKDSKKDKKVSQKYDKKKAAKKDTRKTSGSDSESEWNSTKGEKIEKEGEEYSKKDDKKKSAMKSEESSETESDWEPRKYKKILKKPKKASKKGAKKQGAKRGTESTSAESDEFTRKGSKKPGIVKSSDAESEDSIYRFEAKNRGDDESDAPSIDSKKEPQKREYKKPFKKSTFKGKETKTPTCRVLPSRERAPLPPKVKRLCRCKMPPPLPKPRYAPLPEAKWIQKLL